MKEKIKLMTEETTIGKVILTEEQIQKRAKEIGEQITKDYEGSKDVVFVGILRGAIMWMVDVLKNVSLDCTIDFMACSSYGSSTKSVTTSYLV